MEIKSIRNINRFRKIVEPVFKQDPDDFPKAVDVADGFDFHIFLC